MQGFAEWVVRWRRVLLLVAILVTVGLGTGVRHLSIIIDLDDTLPQTHRFLVATNTADRVFGNKSAIVIGITARTGEPLSPGLLAAVKGITEGLSHAQGVVTSSVTSLSAQKVKDIVGTQGGLDVHRFLQNLPLSDEERRLLLQRVQRHEGFRGLIASDDGTTAAVIAEFAKDKDGFKAIVERVHAIADPYRSSEVEIIIGGQPVFLGLIEKYSDRMLWLFPISLLVIGLIHWEAFRSLQGLALPLVTGLLAVIWSVGVMGWAGVPLDAFNSTTPVLILAIAAGHAVQVLKRYYEEYAKSRATGMDPSSANRLAVVQSLTAVGPVLVAAGTVAALSFVSLTVFEISTIRTFGLFAALGIGFSVLIELSVMPALRASLPAPSMIHVQREQHAGWWDVVAECLAQAVLVRTRAVLVGSLLLAVVLAMGAVTVTIDNSLRSYFLPSVSERIDDANLNRRLAGNNLLYVLVHGGQPDVMKSPEVLRAMEDTQRFLEHEPVVGKTVSIVDFIKQIDASFAGEQRPGRIPESADQVGQYLLLYSMSGEPGDFDSLIDYGYQNAIITAYLKDESSAYLTDLERRLRQFMASRFPSDVELEVGGSIMSPVALNEVLVGNKIMNIGQIALAVFLISSVFFRSAFAGLLILVPLTLAVVANFGLMSVVGIPLQVATATVSAMAVGIGADYAIYLLYRLRQELATTGDWPRAVCRTYHTAGKAVMFVAMAVAGGYSVLLLSWGFLIHFWLGLLISVAMLTSALAALTTTMALIVFFKPKFLVRRTTFPETAQAAAVVACVIGLISLYPGEAIASQLSAVEIMDRNFIATKVQDSTAEVTFRLRNASGQERVRRTISTTKLKDGSYDTMRLTRFIKPADVNGVATLTIENSNGNDDIWIYLPALHKTRRLVSSNKRDSYVGTDFSYGDVIGYKVGEWKHTLVGTEEVDGSACYKIESVPVSSDVSEESGYVKRVSWIRADNFVQIKGEFYDTTGALLKTMSATQVQVVDSDRGRWQAMQFEMRNVQTGHRTECVLENFRANRGIASEDFNVRSLEKGQ
jgi:predicted RND superfamily exporter protein/outer membrane lipoprotein-sorting protein